MLYDFVKMNKALPMPAYRQLYDALRTAIGNRSLAAGQKLLSIRLAAKELSLSRMTIETAYHQLCMEGYLRSCPQRGYFVVEQKDLPKSRESAQSRQKPLLKYDFGSRRIDAAQADLRLWQKHMRSVLSCEQSMISYGEPQGELVLREALAEYAFEARGVRAVPEQVIIGAGMQPLLSLLCGLLREAHTLSIGLPATGFPQAEQVFSDFGIQVLHREKSGDAIPSDVNAYLYLPSRSGTEGFNAEMEKRQALIAWRAARPGRFILEDDYNGELRFRSRPLPALQGMDAGVIFLGSFSKLLLPSIRIAYMVLPEALAKSFRSRAAFYNQTAGKVEQLALAAYIQQGQLEKHLRRLRRLLQKKSQQMEQALQRYLPGMGQMELWETELRYLLTMAAGGDVQALASAAAEAGIVLAPVERAAGEAPQFMLSFAGIPLEDIDAGIAALAQCWRAQARS